MKRLLYKELLRWKDKKDRMPLILEGARQVGKTWLLKEFGKNEYENLAYVNCDNNPLVNDLFTDFDMDRIIMRLSAITNVRIEPGKTLIVLDEIQEVPLALTSLKYFCEDAPQYHVIAAGSLLGLKLHEGTGFPVGKTESLRLYPMTFMEFLYAMGKDVLAEYMKAGRWEELNPLSELLTELLRQYYYVGGMPNVVRSFIQNKDIIHVRELQKRILSDYEKDISKHAPSSLSPKLSLVWNSIPSQLAKENKKFVFGAVRKGARAKDYEDAIQWLIDAGLVLKVKRTNRIEMPLKFHEDITAFKLFVNDLGLLGAMSDTPAKDVLLGTDVFSTYKGSFTEQYVAQMLIAATGRELFYHSKENSTLEIDFILQTDRVYPIEVKAETNLRAKSLSTVLKEDEKLSGIRFSMAGYREQERMVNVPLFLVEEYAKTL